jgi:hypothetical protein
MRVHSPPQHRAKHDRVDLGVSSEVSHDLRVLDPALLVEAVANADPARTPGCSSGLGCVELVDGRPGCIGCLDQKRCIIASAGRPGGRLEDPRCHLRRVVHHSRRDDGGWLRKGPPNEKRMNPQHGAREARERGVAQPVVALSSNNPLEYIAKHDVQTGNGARAFTASQPAIPGIHVSCTCSHRTPLGVLSSCCINTELRRAVSLPRTRCFST